MDHEQFSKEPPSAETKPSAEDAQEITNKLKSLAHQQNADTMGVFLKADKIAETRDQMELFLKERRQNERSNRDTNRIKKIRPRTS